MFGHSFEERYGPWRGDFLKTSFMSAGAEGFDQGSISGGGLDIFDQFWDPNFGSATAGYWPETSWDPFGGMTQYGGFGGGNLGMTLYGTNFDPYWADPGGMWMDPNVPLEPGYVMPWENVDPVSGMPIMETPNWMEPIEKISHGESPYLTYDVTKTIQRPWEVDWPESIPITGELDPRRMGDIQNVAWPPYDPITGELKMEPIGPPPGIPPQWPPYDPITGELTLEPVPEIEIPIGREWEPGYKPKRTEAEKPKPAEKPKEPTRPGGGGGGTTTGQTQQPGRPNPLGTAAAILAAGPGSPMPGGYAPMVGAGAVQSAFGWPQYLHPVGPLSNYMKGF